MNKFILLSLLTFSFLGPITGNAEETHATRAAELAKYTSCSKEWSGSFGFGNDESVFTCSNGHKYHQRFVMCTYQSRGVFFTSEEEDNVDLLCEVNLSSVADCLADNRSNKDLPKCQEERDAERADFIRRSHSASTEFDRPSESSAE